MQMQILPKQNKNISKKFLVWENNSIQYLNNSIKIDRCTELILCYKKKKETVKCVQSPFIKVSKVKVYEKIKELNQKERRVFW